MQAHAFVANILLTHFSLNVVIIIIIIIIKKSFTQEAYFFLQ